MGGSDVIGVGLSGVGWTCGRIVYAGMKGRSLVIWVVCCLLLCAWIYVAVVSLSICIFFARLNVGGVVDGLRVL
jgi:hypothetical protein